MKRLLLLCLTYIMCVGNHQMAAQDSSESPGIFNSLAVGVSASTTGIGIDVASPIGSYLAVRAGVSFMPNFTYSTDVDVDIEGSYEGNIPTSIDVEGGMGRTAGEILLNVYPFKSASFFVCGGAYFGGGKLIKIKGHSDELAELIKEGQEVGIEIGNYRIPGQRKILRGISDKILSLCETNESSAIMETNGYRLLLPEGTLDYFNISDVKESSSEIVIYLEEKNELPGEYSTVKVESKGFYDPVVVRDFPIRGKNLFLNIRRRRWILKDEGRYVSRNWKLVAEGSRMTHEFASFLKELY